MAHVSLARHQTTPFPFFSIYSLKAEYLVSHEFWLVPGFLIYKFADFKSKLDKKIEIQNFNLKNLALTYFLDFWPRVTWCDLATTFLESSKFYLFMKFLSLSDL